MQSASESSRFTCGTIVVSEVVDSVSMLKDADISAGAAGDAAEAGLFFGAGRKLKLPSLVKFRNVHLP